MTDRAVKVMITVPADLLEVVDRVADESGQTRSGFVRDALRRHLASRPDTAKRREAVEALRERLAATGDWNAEKVVRAERDKRR